MSSRIGGSSHKHGVWQGGIIKQHGYATECRFYDLDVYTNKCISYSERSAKAHGMFV